MWGHRLLLAPMDVVVTCRNAITACQWSVLVRRPAAALPSVFTVGHSVFQTVFQGSRWNSTGRRVPTNFAPPYTQSCTHEVHGRPLYIKLSNTHTHARAHTHISGAHTKPLLQSGFLFGSHRYALIHDRSRWTPAGVHNLMRLAGGPLVFVGIHALHTHAVGQLRPCGGGLLLTGQGSMVPETVFLILCGTLTEVF